MNVVVVGAGISGLVCGFRLAQAGHRVTVVEREIRPGGRMSTLQLGSFHLDIGANLLLDNYTRLKVLLGELGMGSEWFPFRAGTGGVLRDHELTSFTPSGVFDVLRYGGLSLASRAQLLRFFLEAYRDRETLDFYDLSQGDDALDDVDAYSHFATHFSAEVADWLVDPFVRTFHCHSSRKLSMKCFEALAALFLSDRGFTSHGLRGFMIALPSALSAKLDVRLGVAVVGVSGGSHPVVDLADGELAADAVVLSAPAPLARALIARPTSAQAALLDGTTYSSTLRVAFTVPRSVAQDFEGIWVPFRESQLIADCANETCKGNGDEGHTVFTLGVHEEAAAALLGASDQVVWAEARAEWERLFPAYRGVLGDLHVQRWPLAMPVYGVGRISAVKRFWAEGQGDDNLWLCGDYLNHPWVEGAVRCGEKVAARISERA